MSRNKQKKDEIEMLYLGIGNKECVQQMHPVIAKIKDTICRKKYQLLEDLRASSTSISDESKSDEESNEKEIKKSSKQNKEEQSIDDDDSSNDDSSELDSESDGLESNTYESISSFASFGDAPKRKKKKRERSREKEKKIKINKKKILKPKEEEPKREKKETIINHIQIINSKAVVQIRKEFFNK